MKYEMEYTHEDENGDSVILDVEFSYIRDGGFCIDAVSVKGTEEPYESYDEGAVLEAALEYAEEGARSDAEDRAVDAWESKKYRQEQMYL